MDATGQSGMTDWDLAPGDTILRVDLHTRYGGSQRGGMTRSSTSANVFLFTDPAVGHQHGYYDGWLDGVFHYTGMGQKGDQEMKSGNRAVLQHEEERRALRLFRGSGGSVTYLGEFTLDPGRPWYRMDAPESGGDAIRQVIVFRLLPTGEVIRDPVDDLQPPPLSQTSDLSAAVNRSAAEPSVRQVPVEEQYTEEVLVDSQRSPYTALRREQTLVRSYKEYLEKLGSTVIRLLIQPAGEARPLVSDLYDTTRKNLVEAKGTGTREAIRMAIGQLADYGRFADEASRRAVLLPERPREDLEALLRTQDIFCVWPERSGFSDNAGGLFV